MRKDQNRESQGNKMYKRSNVKTRISKKSLLHLINDFFSGNLRNPEDLIWISLESNTSRLRKDVQNDFMMT